MNAVAIDRRAVPAEAAISEWRADDGWALRRLGWLQPVGATARGSLFFAGGRGDFIEKYLEPLAHWHRCGWNVTSIDWRGQGGSRGTIVGGHLDSFDPLVADCAAFLRDWIGEQEGPHVAIAHSMGGHILLRTIAERGPALDAAVMVAPMLQINSGSLPAWIAQLAARMSATFRGRTTPAWRTDPARASFRQSILTSCAARFEDELWWKASQPGFELGAPSWGWLDAAYRSSARFTARALNGVQTPVLLVGAERDRLVCPAAIRRAAELLPGAELAMFKQGAHELLRESDAVRLDALARIDDFLDRRAAR